VYQQHVYVKHKVFVVPWTRIDRGQRVPAMPASRLKKPSFRRTFLKEWREHRGYTQEQAAEMIGMDRSNLSRIERAEIPYSQALLEAAAEAYSCEPADLLIRNPLLPDAPWSVYDTLRKADPATQTAIGRAVSGFLGKTGTDG
jgi:transcriptional regulator with XRE-family HTH domain